MASQQSTVAFIVEQMAGAGPVAARKMFGEYGLFRDGKMFALVCDDRLFLKPTPAGRAYAGALGEAAPYPGAKGGHLDVGAAEPVSARQVHRWIRPGTATSARPAGFIAG